MQGHSGTFALNGSDLSLQPTTFGWGTNTLLARGGHGKPIYPAFSTFQLSWGLMPTTDFYQLLSAFEYSQSTGTVVVDLPEWGNPEYIFKSYSGTYLEMPTVGEYFVGHVTDVKLTVTNIRIR